MDVRKPLKRRMKIRKTGEGINWANSKYERLPTFCLFCGMIGHSISFCESFFDYPDKNVEIFFGVWLRAPNRRTSYTGREKWLRSSPTVADGGGEGTSGGFMVSKATSIVTDNFTNHVFNSVGGLRNNRDFKDMGENSNSPVERRE